MSAWWLVVPLLLVAFVSVAWVSRRTDALREVDPQAAQRMDEARLFRGA